MNEKVINQRIKEIKKQLKYCEERDKVCCAFGSEQEIAELEKELEELENMEEEDTIIHIQLNEPNEKIAKKVVKDLLGNTGIQTTNRYLHSKESEEE